jgi:metal-responsive CopG/Arc/MetJ family transcriptional regulator
MARVKTAISVERKLFEQVNQLAKEMHISRSRLFVLAVVDYVQKYENQKLLARINATYDDIPSDEELKVSQAMKKRQSRTVQTDQW